MINLKIIFNLIGFLLILDGIFMLIGIPFSLYYGDNDIFALFISGIGTAVIGFMLTYFTRGHKREIGKRDGYIVVSTGWIVMSFFGAMPFLIHGSIPSFTDAFF